MSGTCAEPSVTPHTASDRWAKVRRFFGESSFALVLLALLATFEVWLMFVLALPSSEHGLGALADDLRVWCFGVERETGAVAWSRASIVLLEPLLLGAAIVWLFRPVLGWNRRVARKFALMVLGAASLTGAATWAASGRSRPVALGDLPFPADVLRTALPAPEFSLTDQEGKLVSSRELRGTVVVMTGVYASCNIACPLLVGQAKRALSALTPEERKAVQVLAISLSPSTDTTEVLARTGERYGVRAPEFRFLGGEPARVDAVLDALQIERKMVPHTAIIDHTSLFVLVDRSGKLAYRLPLGTGNERWLVAALRVLIHEAGPVS